MRNITATHINLYHICKRELWLHANGITMEHTSDLVTEGKMIGEYSYAQRAMRYSELEIEGNKIDFYDAKNKIVHEVKKSAAKEAAHVAQVKYYLYLLHKNGVEGASGLLEYPKLREKEMVTYDPDKERLLMENMVHDVRAIIALETAPDKIKKSACKNCSYFDFCWVEEDTNF
ncbi:MAG TPA: CRISPR-associated protein Cas4 [Saprospiraceae bacterium]|nr:CRISPR-associated protein Cas4 [Saprospiraceae bacterium]HPN69887.1 CRISPR-associated protein Cas4 [Saprospiraceae bacterium]